MAPVKLNCDVEGDEDDKFANNSCLRCGSFFIPFQASPKCRFKRKTACFSLVLLAKSAITFGHCTR